jgi:hypothetical protein
MGKKVTEELHAKVRESLKTMGIMSASKKHGLSPQTVSRIKRGGRYLSGYKRELADDHERSLSSFFKEDSGGGLLDSEDLSRIRKNKPTLHGSACAGLGIEAEMTVLVKNRKLEINIKLAVLLLADGLIILFGMKVLEFICTNNVLRGQF